jgi:hydrogenase/urease accessory protein HupE
MNPKYLLALNRSYGRTFFFLIVPFILLFSSIQTASAHAYSASYTTLNLLKSQTTMTFALDEVSIMELTGGDVNGNGMLDDNEYKAVKNKIISILKDHLILKINGAPQQWTKILETDLNRKGDATQFHLKVAYPAIQPSESISYSDSLYLNDKKTTATYVDLLKINYGNQNSTAALSEKDRTWSMILSDNDYANLNTTEQSTPPVQKNQPKAATTETNSSSTSGWFSFLKLGMNHILTGYDHLLFLLSLLIARQKFKQIATTITAFTIAHSITLTLTVLGIIDVPSKIVEPAIALSICYVSLENIFRQKVSYRWVITFLFGLIHGMGFADLLKSMNLPKSALAVDLTSFNIGIEIIQLSIVLLLLPLLTYLHRSKYSRKAIITVSTIAFILGGIWLVQRILV